jgi:hypothetical protein
MRAPIWIIVLSDFRRLSLRSSPSKVCPGDIDIVAMPMEGRRGGGEEERRRGGEEGRSKGGETEFSMCDGGQAKSHQSPTLHSFIHSTKCTFAVPPHVVFEDGSLPLHQRVFPTVRKGRLKPFKQKGDNKEGGRGQLYESYGYMDTWINTTSTLIRNNTNHLLKCDTQFTIHTRCTHTLHTTHYRTQDTGRRTQDTGCSLQDTHSSFLCILSHLTST